MIDPTPTVFTCTTCGVEATERHPGSRCKPCFAAVRAARNKAYRAANPEKMAAKARREYLANRDVVLARQKERRAGPAKEQVAEYARAYYLANRERLLEKERHRRATRAEALSQYQRKYRAANPDKVNEASSRYRARRRGAALVEPGVSWRTVSERDGLACSYCAVECDPADGWYIAARDGVRRWVCGPTYPTVDHVVPVSRGGDHAMTNAVLACNRCNKSKGAKTA